MNESFVPHRHIIPLLLALDGWAPPAAPGICSVDPPAGTAPAPGTPPATPAPGTPAPGTPAVPEGFVSKEAVQKIVEERIGKSKTEITELQAKIAEMTKAQEDAAHKAALAGKPEHEQKMIELQRELDNAKRTLSAKETEATTIASRTIAAEKTLEEYIARTDITSALAPAVVKASLGDAIELMKLQTQPKVEMGSDGKHRVVYTVAGIQHTNAATAAAEWLKTKPYLVAHPGGGSGTPGNNGSPGASTEGLTIGGLLQVGLQQPLK